MAAVCSSIFTVHDSFNDISYDNSRYLNDMFSIYNPDFENYSPAKYPTELQLNKEDASNRNYVLN